MRFPHHRLWMWMCCTICANVEFPWRLGWSSWRVRVYFNELQGPCKLAEDHMPCLSGATSHRVASLRWWVRDSNCQHECTLRSSREHWDVCVFAQNGVQTLHLIDLIWSNERECKEIDTKRASQYGKFTWITGTPCWSVQWRYPTRFSPLPKMRSFPTPAASKRFGRKRLSPQCQKLLQPQWGLCKSELRYLNKNISYPSLKICWSSMMGKRPPCFFQKQPAYEVNSTCFAVWVANVDHKQYVAQPRR